MMMKFFWRRLRRGDRGFTLIELLIVVAIIAILAAILIPNFIRSRAQSQVSSSKSNLRNIGTALEGFFIDNTTTGYPAALSDLTGQDVPYIKTIPTDPCTGKTYDADSTTDYTPLPTATAPRTSYKIVVDYTGTRCAGILAGINYTPDGGLKDGLSP